MKLRFHNLISVDSVIQLIIICYNSLEWSNQDVVERYLKPINMEHMAKSFLENNINGAVLLALEVNGTILCFDCYSLG